MKESNQDKTASTYSRVLKYTGLFGGVQILKALAALVRGKASAIFLNTVGMGLNAIFQNIAELVHSATNMGLTFSSVRNLSETFEQGNEEEMRRLVCIIRTWSVWAALLGLSVCILFSPLLNWYFFSQEGEDSHLMGILLLATYIFSLPIEAGECAILKATQRLGSIARVEIMAALGTLLFTIPLFYIWGAQAIVPSLICCGWCVVIIHLCYTLPLFSYRIRPFSREIFKAGLPLLRLGIPYVLAAVAGAASTSLVFHILQDPDTIGLFKACYSIIVTYTGMAFVALEVDYFPRLSAANNDRSRRNLMVNQQIDVCSMLISPMLIIMVAFMPWIIRLLMSSDFLPVTDMAVLATGFALFRSLTLPIGYLPLARGESHIFLITETIYDAAYVAIMYFAYNTLGLIGCGVALSMASLLDAICLTVYYRSRYQFHLNHDTVLLLTVQALLLVASSALALWTDSMTMRIAFCTPLLIVSCLFSLRQLHIHDIKIPFFSHHKP